MTRNEFIIKFKELMSNVQPYPFQDLPQYTSAEVALRKKIFNAYHFFTNRPDFIRYVVGPLTEILGNDVQLKITHVEATSLEEIEKSFSQDNSLLGIMRLEPQSKKAGLVFEGLLAKILIHKILSRQSVDQDKIAQLQVKPITTLEEAVVQYFLVALIEKVSAGINDKNFVISYEDVLRDVSQFKGVFSHQEEYAIFSIKLGYLGRDFYLKLILPVSVTQDIDSLMSQEEMINQRIKQFENLKLEFLMEVGYVTLEHGDFDELSAGDIILFDEMLIEKHGNQISGQAEMKQSGADKTEGYHLSIKTEGDEIKAKVESML